MKKILSLILCLIFLFSAAMPAAWADYALDENTELEQENEIEDGGEVDVVDNSGIQDIYPQFNGEFITDDDNNAHFTAYSFVGDSLGLTIDAESTGMLTYQWRKLGNDGNYYDLNEEQYPGSTTSSISVAVNGSMFYVDNLYACEVGATDGVDTSYRTAFYTITPYGSNDPNWVAGQVGFSEYLRNAVPDINRTITSYEICKTLGGVNESEYKWLNLTYANKHGTQSTVLLVDLTTMNCCFDKITDWSENPIVESIVYSKDFKKMAVKLFDSSLNMTGNSLFTFAFALKYTPLTDAECALWLNHSDVSEISGNFLAYEYQMPTTYAGNFNTFANLLFTGGQTVSTLSENYYFWNDLNENARRDIYPNSPAAYDNTGITAINTYKAAVNPDPDITNIQLGPKGYVSEPFLYIKQLFDLSAERATPVYRLEIPTVSETMPLLKITEIKIYTPSEKLKLDGISALSKEYPYCPSTVRANDFDYFWKDGWEISETGNDNGHTYYILEPSENRHFYNQGNAEHSEIMTYGFALVWSLIDTNDPLDYDENPDESARDYMTYAGAGDTVFTYNAVREYAQSEYSCAAPEVYTNIIRTLPDEDTVAWYREGSSDYCKVFAGTSVVGEEWTSIGNSDCYITDETTGKVTVWRPNDHFSAVTQTYDVPYEIMLTALSFKDCLYVRRTCTENVKERSFPLGEATTRLASFKYKYNGDSAWTDADSAWVDAFNTYLASGANTYTTEQAAAVMKYVFPDVDETHYITEVELQWTDVGITKLFSEMWMNYQQRGIRHFAIPEIRKTLYVNDGMYSLLTSADYTVRTEHSDGTPLAGDEMIQVPYSISYNDDTNYYDSGNDDYSESYLYWKIKPVACPELILVDKSDYPHSQYLDIFYADGVTEHDMFYTALNIEGASAGLKNCIQHLDNFKFRYHIEQTTLTDCEQHPVVYPNKDQSFYFSLFTGSFTLTTAMNGWHVEYTTYNKGSTTQRYPESGSFDGMTEETEIQLPIDDGDTFTDILFVCDLPSFDCSPDGANADCFDGDYLVLISKNTLICRDKNLQKTGTPYLRRATESYERVVFNIYSRAYWDNCAGHNKNIPSRHDGINGRLLYTTDWAGFFNLKFYRTATINENGCKWSQPSTVMQGSPVSVTVNMSYNINDKDYLFRFDLDGNHMFPWDISEAVYVEITDPQMTPDLQSCSLFGVPVSSGNVESSLVTIDGRRFVKLKFAEGYVRKDGNFIYYDGDDRHEAGRKLKIYRYLSSAELGGQVVIGLVSDIDATIGTHYPIGNVYMDFTELLVKYDGQPNTADIHPGASPRHNTDRYNSKYFINGNADSTEIGDQTISETNKLFMHDFSEIPVKIAAAGVSGAAVRAGVGDIVQSESPISSQNYYTEDTDTLFARFTYKNDPTIKYNFETIILIPKEGVSAKYVDKDTQLITSDPSERSFYLTGPCTEYKTNAAITQKYTTAADPYAATADWTYDPTASGNSYDNVTGVKLFIGTIGATETKDYRIPLRTDAKTDTEVETSYMGANFTYTLNSTGGDNTTAFSTLAKWTYLNYGIYGRLFFDEDESGAYEDGEAVYSKTVLLYRVNDDSTVTLIDSDVSSATDGTYTLESYEYEADKQKLVFIMPGDKDGRDTDGWQAKPTKQSSKSIGTDLNDNDFPRDCATRTYTYTDEGSSVTREHYTSELSLPRVQKAGLHNVSGGYIYLPKISCADQSAFAGPVSYHATVQTYNNKPDVASEVWQSGFTPATAYRISYTEAADTTIGSITGPNGEAAAYTETAYQQDVTFTPTATGGSTTAKVSVTNRIGDLVESEYSIYSETECRIIITNVCKDAKPNQQFVYTVTDSTGRMMELRVAANSSVTVWGVAPGNCTVTQTDWSWRCTAAEASKQQNVTSTATDPNNTFTFTNGVTQTWLSGNSPAAVNVKS